MRSEEDTSHLWAVWQLPRGRGQCEPQKSQGLRAAWLCVYNTLRLLNTLPGEACSINPQREGPLRSQLGVIFLKNLYYFFNIVATAAPLALSVSNPVDLADVGTNLPWEMPQVENLSKNFQETTIKYS